MLLFVIVIVIVIEFGSSQQCSSSWNLRNESSKTNLWSNCPSWIGHNDSYKSSKVDGTRRYLENSIGATCLDGTVPVIYFREAQSSAATNKWHIYFEGGGACVGVDDALSPRCFDSCAERANTDYGSSNNYPVTSNFDNEYLSTDPNINPLSHDWNTIYIKYCDGAMFLGDNSTLQPTNDGNMLHYRGRRIMIAVFEELVNNLNFNSATDVLLSGCSAGAAAVYAHASYIKATYIPDSAMFLAMPDSGFFLEYQQGEGDFIDVVEWLYNNQNTSSSLNPRCVEYFGEENAMECAFAQNNAQFIDVLTFALQSQYDLFQLNCELVSVNPDFINQYAELFRKTFFETFVNEGQYAYLHAAFLDSCTHHCGEWNNIRIDGVTASQAQVAWYNNHESGDKHIWDQNSAFPCLLCCFDL